MHANIARTTIDQSQLDEAIAGIEAVKARLTAMAGFEAAYWLEPVDGQGFMISFWSDEASAVAAAPPVGFAPAPGVVVDSVETRPVINRA